MSNPVPPEVLRKVRRLAQLPQEARQSRFAVSITRLTVLKSLCQPPERAHRFVTYLARKTLERVAQGKNRSSRPKGPTDLAHRDMMAEALAGMEAWQQGPTEPLRRRLEDLVGRMHAEQQEHKNIPWGAVRLVTDWELLLCEHALRCLLNPPREAGYWAYHMARDYAERYDPRHGTGLTPASAPLVQDIADFWVGEVGLDAASLRVPSGGTKTGPVQTRASARARRGAAARGKQVRFTPRQGQFLAFIHQYRKLHRQGPAELDLVRYFHVTPPSAHGMVVKLEQLGLVTREPGVPRSVRVAIPASALPALEEVEGPPW
jgi:hypothetical protein